MPTKCTWINHRFYIWISEDLIVRQWVIQFLCKRSLSVPKSHGFKWRVKSGNQIRKSSSFLLQIIELQTRFIHSVDIHSLISFVNAISNVKNIMIKSIFESVLNAGQLSNLPVLSVSKCLRLVGGWSRLFTLNIWQKAPKWLTYHIVFAAKVLSFSPREMFSLKCQKEN